MQRHRGREVSMMRLNLLNAIVAGLVIASQAHAVSLGTLVDTHGAIQIGDKQFTNFALHDVSAQNRTPADPRNLDIVGFTNGLGEHGLRVSPFSVSIPNAN